MPPQSQQNNKPNPTNELVPYLLYVYQKELRVKRPSTPVPKVQEEVKYNLTKELVRTNLSLVKKSSEEIGREYGSEFTKMYQKMKLTKFQMQQAAAGVRNGNKGKTS